MKLARFTGLALLATALLLNVGNLVAQDRQGGGGGGGGRGNFDPEQMRQRMMERYRETLDIKDDAAWKLIEERVTKVTEARREVGVGGRGFGGPGMGGPRGNRGGGADTANAQGGQGGQGGRRAFGGEPNPEYEALQKAIEDKASNDEIKAKLAKYRDSRKAKQAKLVTAQEELRKVLTPRQEAAAVLLGLLD